MMQREANVIKEIRLWCGEHNIPCFRYNVGKVKCIDGTWFDAGPPPGHPDLIAYANHTAYFIETKNATGTQRQDQKDFQVMIESHGYKYIVARSMDNVREVIENG